jgi:molybdopterin-synthase adenylyltransferase
MNVSPQTPLYAEGELPRYARHIALREIGGPGQARLKRARVLVVGAGGLGAPVLMYLAAAGVGHITLVDDDTVSLSNLQRQVIHAEGRLGMEKVLSASHTLLGINPYVHLTPLVQRLGAAEAAALVTGQDLVIDAVDNLETRHILNEACVAAGVPLLSGAISQWEGQLTLYDPARGAPCMACLFPVIPDASLQQTCTSAGVVGALPGIIGAMMAAEAIKLLTGAGRSLHGRLLLQDVLWGESREIAIARRPGCPVCGHIHGETP